MNRQDFLRARQNGIGGSDIAAILGVSRFKSPVDVYLAKTNPNPQDGDAEHLYWGHALEAPIINRFCQETGLNVQRQPPIARHSQHEWAVANADALIVDADGKTDGILEIKTAGAFKTREWGASDTDEIPMEYIAQVQWYMGVFGVAYGYLAVLIGGNRYCHYYLERDAELIDIMLAKAGAFWRDHVQARVPPEPQNGNDTYRLHPHDNGETAEADSETLAAYSELKALKAQEKALSEQIARCEDTLKSKIGSRAIMALDGQQLFSWKGQTSRRFDGKAFQAAHPELYKQFTKTTETRILRLK